MRQVKRESENQWTAGETGGEGLVKNMETEPAEEQRGVMRTVSVWRDKEVNLEGGGEDERQKYGDGNM